MEPFPVGTDRLPVSRSFGTVLCKTVHFKTSTHEQFQTTASLSIYQEHEKFLKKIFPPNICSSKPYIKCSSRATFPVIVSYPQSNFPLPRFYAYLKRTVLGVYTRTFWFGSVRNLLSKWTVLVPLAVLYGAVPSVPV